MCSNGDLVLRVDLEFKLALMVFFQVHKVLKHGEGLFSVQWSDIYFCGVDVQVVFYRMLCCNLYNLHVLEVSLTYWSD